jgi:predicted negative regulator of RcsB-dependent stress response
MTAYQTEEEQVEAIKKWWKENGKSAVAGIVLGVGGVLGWQTWNQHQHNVATQAAVKYEQMVQASDLATFDSAIKQAELLISQYEGSAYAVFAAFELARLHQAQGEAGAARQQLEWVLNNTGEQALQQIARLRLARLLLSKGDADGAQRLIDAAPVDSFAGEFAQLRGDVALAKSDPEAARKAYREALAADVGNPDLVQMKLDDLAVSVANP